jgi:hypothetical protein
MSPEFIQPDFFDKLNKRESTDSRKYLNPDKQPDEDLFLDPEILTQSGIKIDPDEAEPESDEKSENPDEANKILSDSGILITKTDEPDKRTMGERYNPGARSKFQDMDDDEKNGIKRPWWQND